MKTLVLGCLTSAAVILVLGLTSRLMFEIFLVGWGLIG